MGDQALDLKTKSEALSIGQKQKTLDLVLSSSQQAKPPVARKLWIMVSSVLNNRKERNVKARKNQKNSPVLKEVRFKSNNWFKWL